jgi:hypothetical protein
VQGVPIIQQCTDPDCPILTMGDLCLDHEHAARVAHPNSRLTGVTAADHEAPGEA